VPRCGAMSLLQKMQNYRGGLVEAAAGLSAELVVNFGAWPSRHQFNS
jgi:hypothetical protein